MRNRLIKCRVQGILPIRRCLNKWNFTSFFEFVVNQGVVADVLVVHIGLVVDQLR